MEGLGLGLLVGKQEIVLDRGIFQKLVLAIFAQYNMGFPDIFSQAFIRATEATILKAVIHITVIVRINIIPEDFIILVGKNVNGYQTPYFPGVDETVTEMAFFYLHCPPLQLILHY